MVRVVLNTLIFRIFSLLSSEVVFLIVLKKNMTDPLGVNNDKMLVSENYSHLC